MDCPIYLSPVIDGPKGRAPILICPARSSRFWHTGALGSGSLSLACFARRRYPRYHDRAMVRKGASEPEPKLTLDLSARTLLSAAVVDAFSGRTLYILETRERDTYLLFLPPDGRLQSNAQVHWPKLHVADTPRVRVQMKNGRWRDSQDFLKFGSVFTCAPLTRAWPRASRAHAFRLQITQICPPRLSPPAQVEESRHGVPCEAFPASTCVLLN
jgi:hypothetical protein